MFLARFRSETQVHVTLFFPEGIAGNGESNSCEILCILIFFASVICCFTWVYCAFFFLPHGDNTAIETILFVCVFFLNHFMLVCVFLFSVKDSVL